MPRDTINANQARPMVATLALGKALGAMCFIPGMSPRYAAGFSEPQSEVQHIQGWRSPNDKVGHSVAENDSARNVFSQVLATRGDRRNLEEIRRNSTEKLLRECVSFPAKASPGPTVNGERLVEAALQSAHSAGLRIIAVCPFVKAYLRKHSESR